MADPSEPGTEPPPEDETPLPVGVAQKVSPFQIPWDAETRKKFHLRDSGHVVVVTNQELTDEHIAEIRNDQTKKDNRVYKNKYDRFNGKYIIEALRKAPVIVDTKKKKIAPSVVGDEAVEEEEEELEQGEEEEEGESDEDEDDREFFGEEIGSAEEKVEAESHSDYDFGSDSEDSTDYFTSNIKKPKVLLTERERKLLRGLHNMPLIDAKYLKKDINFLKTLFKHYYKKNMMFVEEEGEEEEEEEEETTKKVPKEEKPEEEEEDEAERIERARKTMKFGNFYDDGDIDEEEDSEEYELRYEPIDGLHQDTEKMYMDMLGLTPYNDLMEFYRMEDYNLADIDLKHISGFEDLAEDDFPYELFPSFNSQSVKKLSIVSYNHLLDYIEDPIPEPLEDGGLCSKWDKSRAIGSLQAAANVNVEKKPMKKEKIKIKLNDVRQFGEYEKIQMIIEGRLKPKHLKPFKKSGTRIVKSIVPTSSGPKTVLKIPFGRKKNHMLTLNREAPETITRGDIAKLPYVRPDYKRFELEIADKVAPPSSELFQIISTVSVKPEYKYALGQCNDEHKFSLLRHCGAVIFDITRSRNDLAETWFYLKQYIEMTNKKEITEGAKLEKPRHLILITNFLSWARSDRAVKQDINEENFLKRKPHPDYSNYYTLENFVYKIGQNTNFGLRTTIIYSGIPYGREEDVLFYFFKMAWDNEMQIPLYTSGKNILPLIHIDDLAQIVVSTVNQHLYPPLVFALCPNTSTSLQIANAIVAKIGTSKVAKLDHDYNDDMCIPRIIYDLLRQNIKHETVEGANAQPAKFTNPFLSNLDEILEEYCEERELGELTIMLLGPPSKMKAEIAIFLSRFYEIPLYNRQNIFSEYLAMREIANFKPPKEEEEEEEEQVGEEEDENPTKYIDNELITLRRMIDDNLYDLNPQWYIKCLKSLLTTQTVKNRGYICVDYPATYAEAAYVFDETPQEKENVGQKNVTFPEFILVVEEPDWYVKYEYLNCYRERDYVPLRKQKERLDEYFELKKQKQSAENYFGDSGRRVHTFNIIEGRELYPKMVKLIGPPRTNNGDQVFEQFLTEIGTIACIPKQTIVHQKKMEKFFDEAEGLIERSIDRNFATKAYSIREFFLLNPASQYYCRAKCDITDLQNEMRAKTWGYNLIKYTWAPHSTIFRELPSSHSRQYWKAIRGFWL